MVGGDPSLPGRMVLLIWLLVSSVTFAVAQETMASNATNDLPPPGTARFLLNGSEIDVPSLKLMPLTRTLSLLSNSQFQSFNLSGSLVNVGTSNTNGLKSTDLAYISCDDSAYPGNLKASNVISMAASNMPAPQAMVLYSTAANHCNLSFQGAFQYTTIFTTTDPMVASHVQSLNLNHSSPGTASVLPDLSAVQQNNGTADNGTNNGSSNQNNSNVLGPSPTTAVAMVILYSITGIITALFLVIIITGAVRAHRHPERYGPRNVLGRPRQSRAKGIARAMLETLPIVKFGDHDDLKPAEATTDVELGSTQAHSTETESETNSEAPEADDPSKQPSADTTTTAAATEDTPQHQQPRESMESGIGAAQGTPATQHDHDGTAENGTLGCSICTEDFNKGEEVRVLPCKHKFHPECIDPWLLNVSGTCPLCRIDLRPPQEETPESPTNTENPDATTPDPSNLPPPLESTGANAGSRPRSSIISSYFSGPLNARRMRDASTEERIMALRRLRTQNRSANQEAAAQASEQERRGVSSRLRDRFRVRTRRQGVESAVEPTAPPATVVEEPAAESQGGSQENVSR